MYSESPVKKIPDISTVHTALALSLLKKASERAKSSQRASEHMTHTALALSLRVRKTLNIKKIYMNDFNHFIDCVKLTIMIHFDFKELYLQIAK